jgi:hypothetical protein
MSKFVPRESGGDETQVQKMVIGGWDGPTIQPQPQDGRVFQVQKDAAGRRLRAPLSNS